MDWYIRTGYSRYICVCNVFIYRHAVDALLW